MGNDMVPSSELANRKKKLSEMFEFIDEPHLLLENENKWWAFDAAVQVLAWNAHILYQNS